MAKDKEQRYQSMYALLEDLQRLEAGVGTMARETTRSVLTQGGSIEAPVVPAKKGNGALIAALGVLLLAGGGTAAYFALAQEPEPQVVQNPPVTPDPPPVVDPDPPPTMEPVNEVGATTMVEETVMAAPEVMVRIVSEPASDVWRGEEYVGRTPVEIARPTGSDRLDLELRAEGFETREFLISSLTSPQIEFRLERARVSSSSRMGGMEAAPRATMETTMATTSTMRNSEVLDPWAAD
jgi:hypothetical protein